MINLKCPGNLSENSGDLVPQKDGHPVRVTNHLCFLLEISCSIIFNEFLGSFKVFQNKPPTFKRVAPKKFTQPSLK